MTNSRTTTCRRPLASLPLAFAVALLVLPARAEEPPDDVAAYDCTRTDDGKTVPGDKLTAQGFQTIARSRFGNVSLMMMEPKSSVRANCILRKPAGK